MSDLTPPLTPKGERTRQNLLDAAHSLFLEQGYAGTSMRQISERAGLALSAIYNHFPSKESIFVEVLMSHHPFHTVFPLLMSAPGDSAEEFVRNGAHIMIAELGRKPDFIKLFFIEIVEFEGRNLPRMFTTFYPKILPMVERFQNVRGEVRGIPPAVLFRAFLGMFFSYYMTEMLLANVPVKLIGADHLDHFVDIFLHGILTPKE